MVDAAGFYPVYVSSTLTRLSIDYEYRGRYKNLMAAKKRCSTCKRRRSTSTFNRNAAKPDGLQATCRDCGKVYSKAYYKGHAPKMRKQITAKNKERMNRVKRKVHEYLVDHPCVDCEESDLVVLEFDHRDGEEKVTEIGTMLKNRYSWTRIEAEIAKCDVRCANCHRRKTAKDQGWLKAR